MANHRKGWADKPKVVRPKQNTQSLKVNLKPQDFDELIENQGIKIKVYRSVFCPNVKSIDGAEHEIDCPLCHGAQFIDRYPIETWAFFQSQDLEKIHQSEGLIDANTVASTFMQGIELQYFTLVEICDHTEIFYQRVKRQNGNLDILKYKAKKVNMLIDHEGLEYFEGSDFSLDANGNIKWKANKGPLRDTIYSVHYDIAIQFRAVRAQHVNRFANVDVESGSEMVRMNEQWQLQKDYLVERKDLDGNIISPNKIRDEDF